MMIGDIKGKTRQLGGPANCDMEVGVLPIQDVIVDGHPCMISEWIPDQMDLEILRRGGSIKLAIFGTIHPVVSVYVQRDNDA